MLEGINLGPQRHALYLAQKLGIKPGQGINSAFLDAFDHRQFAIFLGSLLHADKRYLDPIVNFIVARSKGPGNITDWWVDAIGLRHNSQELLTKRILEWHMANDQLVRALREVETETSDQQNIKNGLNICKIS